MYLGIDIGGGSIKATLLNSKKEIDLQDFTSTNSNWTNSEFLEAVLNLIKKFPIEKISGIGIGTPGPLDIEEGVIFHSANLQNLKNVPLKNFLKSHFNIPIFINNDANCAALGEYYFGNGKGVNSLLVVALGTGLGAGWVYEGKLFNGYKGNGMELGHTTIVYQGAVCGCGKRGCAESYFSTRGLLGRYFEKTGIKLQIAQEFFDKVRNKEERALEVFQQGIEIFAECLRNVIHTINPAKIVLVGGLTNSYDLIEPLLKAYLQKILFPELWNYVIIEKGGSVAGSLGAASLLFQEDV
ncbi:MAG: ROK family protein [Leptospiraceae bacterium]|nr:ROK family protein [Leptospiraceae bacterium]